MTTATNIKTREHVSDQLREAQGGHVEVRHVAVILPLGAHFKLRPSRASLEPSVS